MTGGSINNNNDGSGIAVLGGKATITGGEIIGHLSPGGDGIHMAGAADGGATEVVIGDCLISGNTSSDGGGIYIDGGHLTLDGARIEGNEALADGGICFLSGLLTLRDCTITNNEAASQGGGIYVRGRNPDYTHKNTRRVAPAGVS